MKPKTLRATTKGVQHTYRQRLTALLAVTLMMSLSVSLLAGCQTNGGSNTGSGTPQSGSASSGSSASGSAGSVTFTDDLGNEVTVTNPQRVVATMGSFAKIWELAGGALVGVSDDVDTYSGYALSSSDVERVGDFTSVDMEKVIALEPDFVIMTGSSTGRAGAASQTDFKETLDSSGIPVAYFTVTTFEDYLRMLATCCEITGHDELYTKNGHDVQIAIDEIVKQVPEGEKPRVLLMSTYSGGTRVQNSSTQTGAMLADLGVTNIADENPSLLQDFSLEAVIETNPDFIFVVPMGENTEEAMRSLEELTTANPAWSQIDAVANGNYITLDPGLFQYKPNEKWASAYQELFDYLYA